MRALPLLLIALVWPAAATPSANPALTLKAPEATRFAHRIDFVGRLTPARPGAPIVLLRGGHAIASGSIRGDGTYRIRARVATPGPFQARAAGVLSNAVIVRIHPLIDARVIGSRVIGSRLTLVAHLRPLEAGGVRVRVLRDGRQTFTRVVQGEARVLLGTQSPRPFEILVDAVPRSGYTAPSREFRVALRLPAVALGSGGQVVADLARRLAVLHYAVPYGLGPFDEDLQESVYAFEKVQELPRTGVADERFWRRLANPILPSPRYRGPDEHIEIDKARQVLFVVREGKVVLISPVSTAGIPGYFTPVGRFAIYRKVPGYDPSPLGVLYKPMYFTGGYAIHGNPSVPPYPASHGCIRVPNFIIERLFQTEPYGETVYVY